MRLGIGSLVLVTAACGLIKSDVTDFNLVLPDKTFTIDASAWQVNNTEAQAVLGTTCTGSQQCNTVAMAACAMGCTGTCLPDTSKCQLSLQVSLYQPVDLVTEQPELKTINDQPVIKVTIDSVQYEVKTNSLNVDTPEMTIYVAPMSVMSPTDPMATAIGTIPAVHAGTTTSTPQDIQFTTAGKQSLIDIMSTYKTPFNVIVGAVLVVKQGTPVPAGKLDAVVHITAHAGI